MLAGLERLEREVSGRILVVAHKGVIRTIVITELATGIGILATLVLPGMATFILLPLVGVVLQGTSSVIYGTIGDLVEPDKLPRAFAMEIGRAHV